MKLIIRLLLITILLFNCQYGYAAEIVFKGVSVGHAIPVEGIADNVTFFLSCDSKSDAEKANGSATVNWDASISINTVDKVVGTGCADQNNAGYHDFDFVILNNFDYTNSRIGFWFRLEEATTNAGTIVWTNTAWNAPNGFRIEASASGNTFNVYYLGNSTQPSHGMIVGTWYYLELEFTASELNLYRDGTLFATRTSGGNSFTDTSISFGASDGNALDQLWDNIARVNDHTISLYEYRNEVYSD